MSGIGVILMDSNGEVLFTASVKEHNFQEPEAIKTLAILHGLQLSMHLSITKIIIDSNCQWVIKEIQGIGESTFFLGNLVQDIKGLMARFKYCSI